MHILEVIAHPFWLIMAALLVALIVVIISCRVRTMEGFICLKNLDESSHDELPFVRLQFHKICLLLALPFTSCVRRRTLTKDRDMLITH